MDRSSQTDNGQSASGGLTHEEALAKMKTITAGIERLQREQELFRKEWPTNALLVVKMHVYGLFKLIQGKDKLDTECFMAVHEATSVFLNFLEEERRYVEAGATDKTAGAPDKGGK